MADIVRKTGGGKNLGCILETVGCSKLIPGRNIGWEYRCAMLWYDFNFLFDLTAVTLTFKILYGLYLRNCNV